jgi:glycine oxidase
VTPVPERADVVVLGGGVIGLALALELAYRGVDVAVFERGRCADTATSALGAAAGMVNPQAHPGVEPEPVRDLALLSRHLWGEWVERIEEEAGLSCEYDVRGGMTVALTETEEVALDRSLDWQRARELPFEVLGPEEACDREPALARDVRAAFAFPLEGHVNPRSLGLALAAAVRSAGARLCEHTPALELVVEEGRVAGVVTAHGTTRTDTVVLAMGAWGARFPGAPAIPVEPVRGQLVLLDASADPCRLTRFVHAPDVYLVPRRGGGLVVGSTLERAGFDARPTAAGVAGLLERAAAVSPAILEYPFVAAWAGLRPATPDEVPILGETTTRGLVLAAGHFKNGILLAPGTAALLADLLTAEKPAIAAEPYSPGRFDL